MQALLDQSDVMPDTHRDETDVDVGEGDREEADERPLHVPPIEAAGAVICRFPNGLARQLVQIAADDVTHRVAAERIAGEKDDVGGENDRPEADAELFSV